VVVLSAGASLALTVALAGPLIEMSRAARWGCSRSSDGPVGYLCPDGVAYAVPVAVGAGLLFAVGLVIGVRVSLNHVPQDQRLILALRIEHVLGAAVSLGGVLGLARVLLGPYDHTVWWVALAPIALGLAAVRLPSSAGRARVAVMTSTAVALLLLCQPVFLLSPLLVVAAGLALASVAARSGIPTHSPAS